MIFNQTLNYSSDDWRKAFVFHSVFIPPELRKKVDMKLFFYQFNCRQNTRFKPPCLVIKCSFFKMSVVFNLNLVSGRVRNCCHTTSKAQNQLALILFQMKDFTLWTFPSFHGKMITKCTLSCVFIYLMYRHP